MFSVAHLLANALFIHFASILAWARCAVSVLHILCRCTLPRFLLRKPFLAVLGALLGATLPSPSNSTTPTCTTPDHQECHPGLEPFCPLIARVQSDCPLVCGLCTDATTRPPAGVDECEGGTEPTDCNGLEQLCGLMPSVYDNCPRTCGRCDVAPTTSTVAPATSSPCVDLKTDCAGLDDMWCVMDTVKAECPKLCNECDSENVATTQMRTSSTTSTAIATCNGVEDDADCAMLEGLCYIGSVRVACPAMCGSCGEKPESSSSTYTTSE